MFSSCFALNVSFSSSPCFRNLLGQSRNGCKIRLSFDSNVKSGFRYSYAYIFILSVIEIYGSLIVPFEKLVYIFVYFFHHLTSLCIKIRSLLHAPVVHYRGISCRVCFPGTCETNELPLYQNMLHIPQCEVEFQQKGLFTQSESNLWQFSKLKFDVYRNFSQIDDSSNNND